MRKDDRMRFKSIATAAALVLLCGAAVAKSGEGGGILPGAKASDPVKIDADKLDYFDREQKLIYTGSVIVVNGPSTLKSTRMVILLDNAKNAPQKAGEQGASSSNKVRHVEAEGPVTLVSPDQVATGDHLTFDRAENKVHLTGNVTWTRGETVVNGAHLVYDLQTKEARVLSTGAASGAGRVQSLFTPKSGK